jgi:hypothetical protein
MRTEVKEVPEVVIKFKGIEFTEREARELYGKLKEVFDNQVEITYPICPCSHPCPNSWSGPMWISNETVYNPTSSGGTLI